MTRPSSGSGRRAARGGKTGDGDRLKALLGDPGSSSPYSGEKKCGGFHPDYAVEWSAGGQVDQALIGFGCFEAGIYGPDGGTTYDVGRDAQERFKAPLQPYRKNRPPFRPTESPPPRTFARLLRWIPRG